MNAQLVHYIRGYVKLEIAGSAFEKLVNRLVESKIPVWDIKRTGSERGEFLISLPDFFRLKPFLKETGCRIHVTGRYGVPFGLDKLGTRKWFAAGAFIFIIGLYMLSLIVWSVEVTGNETIPEEQILEAAAKEGVYPLQWKFRMEDQGVIADNLARTLPNVAWVGVDLQGTTLTIRVVESTVPKPKTPQNPRHIVSASDAVITSIQAERGVPQVGVHARVKQGDILISGILGDENNRQVVVAEGKVRGLVWYEYKVQSPVVEQLEALTGNLQTKQYLVLGNRALQLSGYRQEAYAHEQKETERKQLRFGSWTAPIGWMTEISREAELVKRKLTATEAKEIGLANARADLIAALGGDTVIREEKILQERVDNGKVIMNVLFEAEVDLAAERPILEQELAPPKKDTP